MADNYYTIIRDVLTDAFDVQLTKLDELKISKKEKLRTAFIIKQLRASADNSFVEKYKLANSIINKIGK